jgi:hypothetical protein
MTNTNTIKSFTYNGYTIDLFINTASIFWDYAITIFSPENGTMFLHDGINDIYKAINIFDGYKMDLLKEGQAGIKEGAKQ